MGKGVEVGASEYMLGVVNSMLKRRCPFVTMVGGMDADVPGSPKPDMFPHSTPCLP